MELYFQLVALHCFSNLESQTLIPPGCFCGFLGASIYFQYHVKHPAFSPLTVPLLETLIEMMHFPNASISPSIRMDRITEIASDSVRYDISDFILTM